MQFRKKPVVIEATQWFKNGDHPLDHAPFEGERTDTALKRYDDYKQTEGKIVRYYRHPCVNDVTKCKHCGAKLQDHGWVATLEGGHIVCPGDWIITGVNGERYPCKPDIFAKTYEAVESSDTPTQGLTFDAALELLKGGAKVARTRWLDKGRYLELIRAAHGSGEDSTFFAIKCTGSTLRAWYPEAADCLATDWAVWSDTTGEPDGSI